MADDQRDEVIARLQAELIAAMDMIEDLTVRVEAQRRLLRQKKVFSDADFEAMRASIIRDLKAFYSANAGNVLKSRQLERLRKLLEDFEGEPQ